MYCLLLAPYKFFLCTIMASDPPPLLFPLSLIPRRYVCVSRFLVVPRRVWLLHYLDDHLAAGALNSRQCLNTCQHPQPEERFHHVACLYPGDFISRGASRKPQHSTLPPRNRARHSPSCRPPSPAEAVPPRYEISPSPGPSCAYVAVKNWCLSSLRECSLKYPSRPSLRRWTDLPCCKHSQSRVIRLSHDPTTDLLWWSSFLRDWIVVSLSISPRCLTVSDLLVSNNAAGVAAFGTHLDGLFAHRLLASRETKGKVIPLLVLAQTYGAINGIASGCSSSVTWCTRHYPQRFSPRRGARGSISCPACSSRPSHSF